MKKIYQTIIFLVTVLFIHSSDDNCYELNPSKKSTCHDKTVANSGYYCCYFKQKFLGETFEMCSELSKEDKENIKEVIKEAEKNDVDIKSLDCKSSIIEFGLLSLMLLLF
jgi:hypothetical protein